MKAILNHAFLFGHKEFVPIYEDSKGGNVLHQIDSVYFFTNWDDQRFRIAISIAVNKLEIDINELKQINMIGMMDNEKIIEYNHPLTSISDKGEFEDIKIYKWTDYILL